MWIIIPLTICVIGIAIALLPPATPEQFCRGREAERPKHDVAKQVGRVPYTEIWLSTKPID